MRRRELLVRSAAALALSGCGDQKPPEPGARPPLRLAHESDIYSLDPAFADDASHSILSNLYETLVAFDRDMALVPGLAVQWSTEDDRTWVFELREHVRFHDGTPLTAATAKEALERLRATPEAVARRHIATVQAIEAVGEQRLRLVTGAPDPLLINRLTFVLLARASGDGSAAPKLVGTGPYQLERWQRGSALEARAFPSYWGRKPAIEAVRFVPVTEGERTLVALRRAEVDVLRWVPETLAEEVRALPHFRLETRPGLGTYYLWMSAEAKTADGKRPFADRRVREALSLAIDRKEILRRLGGQGVVADQLVQKGVFGYVEHLGPLPHDPGRARALLKEAGFPGGFTMELTHRSAASITTVAEALREMLAAVGVQVTLRAPNWTSVVADWRAGRLPFFLAGWRFDSGDAYGFLVDCLLTRNPQREEGGNNPGFSSPALDRAIREHGAIVGESQRLRHYETLMAQAREELPIIPLYTRANLFGVSDAVRWEPRLDGKLLAAEMGWK